MWGTTGGGAPGTPNGNAQAELIALSAPARRLFSSTAEPCCDNHTEEQRAHKRSTPVAQSQESPAVCHKRKQYHCPRLPAACFQIATTEIAKPIQKGTATTGEAPQVTRGQAGQR